MRRSLAMARIAPAPAQMPSMAATMGCGHARMLFTRSPVIVVNRSRPARSPRSAISTSGPMISRTSPPEQKLPPAPVSTTARTSGLRAERAKRRRQFGVRIERQRILALGPIERDGRHATVHAPAEMLRIGNHDRTSPLAKRRRPARSSPTPQPSTATRLWPRRRPSSTNAPPGDALREYRARGRFGRAGGAGDVRDGRVQHGRALNVARTHGIHRDAGALRFRRQRASEPDDAMFCRAVGGHARVASQSGRRRDVDDAAFAGRKHRRQHALRAEKRPGQIHIDHVPPLVQRRLLKRSRRPRIRRCSPARARAPARGPRIRTRAPPSPDPRRRRSPRRHPRRTSSAGRPPARQASPASGPST